MLRTYGITPERMDARSGRAWRRWNWGSCVQTSRSSLTQNAAEDTDYIIPINRVKPHTDFVAPIESGLVKMIAIGLGKQRGADTFHRQGFARFHELLPAVASFTLEHAPIPFGLALIENGYGRLMHIESVPAESLLSRERELLNVARAALARIPLAAIDVLIIDYIGKDISGLGMDSNVVGRYYRGPTGDPPLIQRIVVRDLTEVTDGNAVGIGLADVVLRRAVEKLDERSTYMNCITAKTPEGARIALTVDTDFEAMAVASACCLDLRPPDARIVRILDTKNLEYLLVSAPALSEILASGRCEIVEPLHPVSFDAEGMMTEALPPPDGSAGSH